jgi:tetratricopeptide (TPR) repeat protein
MAMSRDWMLQAADASAGKAPPPSDATPPMIASAKQASLETLDALAQQSGRAELAIESISRAMEQHAANPLFHYNLANSLRDRGRADQAIAHYRRAVELDPRFAAAWLCLGALLFEQGRLDEALASFDRGLEFKPHDAKARLIRGMIHLQAGDFSVGWREYEWRRSEIATGWTASGMPYWAGESLAGKTLLVEPEESLADQIMFASCLSDVVALADEVTIAADARLATLLTRSFPAANVIQASYHRRQGSKRPEAADYRVAIGSLPRYLRSSSDCFPRHRGYLSADRGLRHAWWQRLSRLGPGLKIGIAWRGAGALAGERSITLEQWSRIVDLRGASFVSLQGRDAADEIAQLAKHHRIVVHDFAEAAASDDLDNLAALVAALDLVIAVPNTVAHLAGALGVEVRNLLAWSSSWRWMLKRDDSPWYPSMRLLRQSQAGGWEDVLDRVHHELMHRLAAGSTLRGPHRRQQQGLVKPAGQGYQ